MRRAIILLIVMVLICLVEIILFYFLTDKLIKAFKLMDGKINKLILWGYRLLFWGSIGLIVFCFVTSLSTGRPSLTRTEYSGDWDRYSGHHS
ncbi:TPA: hypothetical protein ACGO3D_000962 [Streptococcus suis]